MGKHAQLVIGPAGSGKSTYCRTIQAHCEAAHRVVHIVNLDPAAEHFDYKPAIDIRDLISLEDAMEELDYGPNGGLIFCMEYLVENITWLEDQINDYPDDYIIFDCPGQIELYSHLPVMKTITECLLRAGFNMCGVYLIDSLVVSDASRFIAGSLMCLSAMIQLELPHVNILSKCDMVPDKKVLDRFLDPDVEHVIEDMTENAPEGHRGLNRAVGNLLSDYNMVSFLPLDVSDEDSIFVVLAHIDNAIQYGEDLEPKEPKDEGPDEDAFEQLQEMLSTRN